MYIEAIFVKRYTFLIHFRINGMHFPIFEYELGGLGGWLAGRLAGKLVGWLSASVLWLGQVT